MKRIITILVLALLPMLSWAADLTPAQRAVIRADIQADPVLSALPPSSDAISQIIAAYAAPAACTVWKSALTPEDARRAITQGAIQLDNLTVGKRDALLYITQGDLAVSDVLARQTLDDLCGTQNTLKTALQNAQKRTANRLEKLFASGLCTPATPATMAVEGGLDYSQVLQIMGW